MRFPFRIHRRRLVRRVTLGLAVLAVAAPSAQALTLDPGGLPCAPECSATEVQSVLHAGTGAPRTVTIPPELSGRQFGPTVAGVGVDPARLTPAVSIPESLSGRQFGPTGAAPTVDRATRAVPIRGVGARYAHTAASNADGSAGEIAAGVGIGIAAVFAVALAAMSLGRRRRGELAHA